jgi:hypothetical protein
MKYGFFIFIITSIILILLGLLYLYYVKSIEAFGESIDDVKIDIVYTWVDGNDPKWKQKKSDTTSNFTPQIYEDARYQNMDELKYSLRSVFKYANWVNKIYIVVDDVQTPSFVNLENPKIQIIKHSDIIEPKYLPVFNSVAIEANIHHIPTLSENFLYLNDDIFFGNYITKQDVYNICYYEINPAFETSEIDAKDDEWICNIKNGYQLVKRKYPNAKLYIPTHDSHFCKRSLMYEIEKTWFDVYKNTLKQKLRKTNSDVKCNSICLPKMQYILGICKGIYTPILGDPDQHLYFDMFNQKDLSKLESISRIKPKFFCINNNNSYSDKLNNVFNTMFDFKSPYEI